jgi:hypothetical protein
MREILVTISLPFHGTLFAVINAQIETYFQNIYTFHSVLIALLSISIPMSGSPLELSNWIANIRKRCNGRESKELAPDGFAIPLPHNCFDFHSISSDEGEWRAHHAKIWHSSGLICVTMLG